MALAAGRIHCRADALPIDALIVQKRILCRASAMALLAGGALALATMLLRQIMRNPLASDSTLAVSSGARNGFGGRYGIRTCLAAAWGNAPVAFGGAALALALVLWLSARRDLVPLLVVLAGLVTALYFGRICGHRPRFLFGRNARHHALGGRLTAARQLTTIVCNSCWRIAAAAALIAILAKPLAMMSLSDTQAAALGMP